MDKLDFLKKIYSLSETATLFLNILALYELDEDFKENLINQGEASAKLGINYEVLAGLTDNQIPLNELYLIADKNNEYFRLKQEFISFLYDKKHFIDIHNIAHIYSQNDIINTQNYDDLISENILNSISNPQNETLFINIYGKKASGRLHNIKYVSKKRNKGLMLIYANEVLKRDVITVISSLLFKALIDNLDIAFLCDTDEINDLLKEISWLIKGKLDYIALISNKRIDFIDIVYFETKLPTRQDTYKLWQKYSKQFNIELSEIGNIISQYILTESQLHYILKQSKYIAYCNSSEKICKNHISDAFNRYIKRNFHGKATKMNSNFTWKDIVLADDCKYILNEICNQYKFREKVYMNWGFSEKIQYGTGNIVLFTGTSGVGKTMVAQVIANEMELDLYKVNLPAVISKYIGETEKNLNDIFEEASKNLCVLFFDEADVLFSKRIEMKDAQDKYNNMETAFLLQKMEEYDGISILATNLQQNIDEAFKRRLKYIVSFSMPDAKQRKILWDLAFPKNTPLAEDINLTFLSEKFDLSAANIKNIALNAAFNAAAENSDVSMKHIFYALQNEYKKSGRIITKEYFDYI